MFSGAYNLSYSGVVSAVIEIVLPDREGDRLESWSGSLRRQTALKSPGIIDEEKPWLSRPSRDCPLSHGPMLVGHRVRLALKARVGELRWYREATLRPHVGRSVFLFKKIIYLCTYIPLKESA